MSTSVAAILALSVLSAYIARYFLFRAARKGSRLRGPPNPPSWLLGHEIQLLKQTTAGELERQWTEEYGTVTRLSSFAGQTTFLLSDPKGLQYVMNEKATQFPKGGDNVLFGMALSGRGVSIVSGQTHLRQRRVLTPAYSTSMTREWAELFQDHGDKRMPIQMMEMIKSQVEESPSVNILEWSAKFALDVLGLSGFRHQFGAIDGADVPIAKQLHDAFGVAATKLGIFDLVLAMLAIRLPEWAAGWLSKAPTPVYLALNRHQKYSHRAAAEVMQVPLNDPKEREQKDVSGLLASSFHASDPEDRLQMDEILSQMSTLLVASQDTTASSEAVLMYMLATHPADQQRLRAEIQAMYASKAVNEPLEPADYDKLPFLNAVIKETLRLYTPVHTITRHVSEDEVIPLAYPVTLEDDSKTTTLPVQKGERLLLSLRTYNRLRAVWGDDAAEWNPDRFLDGRPINSSIGLFGNVMTFSFGVRGCLGWKFALVEMQVVTALLVKTFEVSAIPSAKMKLLPTQFVLMPVIEGKEDEGPQVHLQFKVID